MFKYSLAAPRYMICMMTETGASYNLMLDYLQEHFPEGMPNGFTYISWEIVYRCYLHYIETDMDELTNFNNVIFDLCNVNWTHRNKFYRFITPKIELFIKAILSNNSLFTIDDIEPYVSNGNEDAFYKYINALRSENISPKTYNNRRKVALRVTNIPSVRRAIFKRDGMKCSYCGSTNNLCIDHIIPVRHGGEDTYDNFQVLCRSCNSSKSDKIPENSV